MGDWGQAECCCQPNPPLVWNEPTWIAIDTDTRVREPVWPTADATGNPHSNTAKSSQYPNARGSVVAIAGTNAITSKQTTSSPR